MAKPRSAADILQKGNKKANQLSPAMFAWAKANREKLRKVATKSQKKIFAKYDAMLKAGNTPANPNPRPAKPSKPKNSAKLKANTQPKKQEFPSFLKNEGTGRDGKFGTGTYGRGYPDDKRKKLMEKVRRNKLG